MATLQKLYVFILVLFAVSLISFAFFSKQVLFHDTPEYIVNTKVMAGYLDEKIDSPHSFLYPLSASFFVKYLPSLLTIKLFNVFWIFLDAIALYYFFRSRNAFLLLLFSPLVWVVSIQFSPVMPASFFVLLTYGFMKMYEKENRFSYLAVSALSCGLALALYAPVIVFVVFFLLAYFYNRKFKFLLFYLILVLVTFSLELLTSYLVTGFPFYSLVRYYGTNIAVFLGYNPGTSSLIGLKAMSYLDLFLISPLIFLLYRLDFSKYRKELFFLIPVIVFFVLRGGQKQLFIFTPIILLLLGTTVKKKSLIISILISVFLAIFLVYPYFQGPDRETLFVNDMSKIRDDFPSYNNMFSVEMLDLYWWDSSWPRFITIEEYDLFLKNETYYKDYKYSSPRLSNILKWLDLHALMVRSPESIEQPLLVVEKGHNPFPGYTLSKCYQILCVYESNIQ